MKKLLLAMLAVILCSTIDARAGFVTKKHNAVVEAVSPGNAASPAAPTHATKATKKRAIIEKVASVLRHDSDAIPKPLYVVLAIIALGWLAMGINDNFEGWNWVLSLVLYILGWLPGVIYTLIMMKDYY